MNQQRRSAILHIGAEKTGTTSIQAVLASKRKELLDLGFCYPSSPGHVSHVALAVFAAPENMPGMVASLPSGVQDGDFDEVEFALQLADEMTALPAHVQTVIFSNEHCHSRLVTTEQIQKLKSLLAIHFNDIIVVLYLRRQDQMACSAYSTLLRIGDTGTDIFPHVPSFGQYTGTFRDYTWSYYFDFERLLDRYALVFGKQSIRLRLFEASSLEHGDVVVDFLKTCGLPPWLGKDAKRINQAIPAEGQEFLILLNKYLAHPPHSSTSELSTEMRNLCAFIAETRLSGSPQLPARADAWSFYAQFREMNERIRAAWCPERPTLFVEDFSSYRESEDSATASQHERALRAAFAVIEHLVEERQLMATELQARADALRAQDAEAQAAQGEVVQLTRALALASQQAAAERPTAPQHNSTRCPS